MRSRGSGFAGRVDSEEEMGRSNGSHASENQEATKGRVYLQKLGQRMIVLITGMSGTDKSTVIADLQTRGHLAIDLDEDGWSHWVPCDGNPTGAHPGHDWLWDEARLTELLDEADDEALFLSGCAPNMGKFAQWFDQTILLTAPANVILERVARRVTNAYGKSALERDAILANLQEVEPLLRSLATREIDATQPLGSVVDEVLKVVK